MTNPSVGISDISLFVPASRISLESLVEYRGKDEPVLAKHLQRALKTTGQKFIRFPKAWEDPATLGAEAAKGIFTQNNSFNPDKLRYIVVGTETGLDHSKPMAAYVQGMLTRAGYKLPKTLSTFQTQHACAGGFIAMTNVLGMLQVACRDGESGIVISTDVSRYKESTTAEITQGAGAAAALLERNPKLVELDLSSLGYSSDDVDDFFRPLGQETAEVKGRYSVKCYHEALEGAFLDYADRAGISPKQALLEADMFVLHTPFRNMPEAGMLMLLKKYADMDKEEAMAFLEERGFYDGIDAVSYIGNIYTGSLFLAMAFSLRGRYRKLGKDIIGKKVFMASYGSGNTMTITGGTIAKDAPGVIENWDLDALIAKSQIADINEYEDWISHTKNGKEIHHSEDAVPEGAFFLSGIREDGYREYKRK